MSLSVWRLAMVSPATSIACTDGSRRDGPLADDYGSRHPGPVRQAMIAAVVLECPRRVESEAEFVTLTKAYIGSGRAAFGARFEQSFIGTHGVRLIADLRPSDRRARSNDEFSWAEIRIDNLRRLLSDVLFLPRFGHGGLGRGGCRYRTAVV